MEENPEGNGQRSARRKTGEDFLVVGIGASAGGVRALEQFFERMPPDPGMAFVAVLHLSPEHESNLAGMIRRYTAMPVEQISGAVPIKPNHVYVIPPAKHLVMEDGHIRLAEPDGEAGRRVPIDVLFRSLGANYREHAIGVVLSGTGSDGTLGLRRIKEEGGISIAQDPQEAEYDAMPRAAIREGLVDFVLPVVEMPAKIIGIRDVSQKIKLPPEGNEPPKGRELDALRDMVGMLRVRTGYDFSGYKQSSLLRRVTRRMQMRQVPDLAGYLRYLREHPAEVPELMQDLLISVTNFFRDSEAFDFLAKEVVPKVFEGKKETDQVRVWVTGCATGEEAYSVAILLAEHAAGLERPPRIQVFATDLDEAAIGQARDGAFPETIAADVSPERLKQFFVRERDHYFVKKHVRETVLFAAHNVLRDPPFSRLDMVSCRNLLIYLNREAQDRVLEVFHFSLQPGGFLFLGSAESADSLPDLFSPVQKKLRVYRRTTVASTLRNVPPMPLLGKWVPRTIPDPFEAGLKSYRFAELHRTLLEHYAPPSVLVNETHDLVHVSDTAGRFLRVAGGEPSRNLLSLVHPELRLDLRAALFSAMQEMEEVTTRPLLVNLDGGAHRVRMRVRPVTRPDLHATYLLVIFDGEPAETALAEGVGDEGAGARPDVEAVARLEEELQQMRTVLRATVEQHETSTEELRASNEELQALNEELRSTTEELGRTNADLSNLLVATEIATVFLDRQLNIARYTPHFTELFNVRPADVGRPLADLTHHLDYDELSADAARVLRRLEPFEREVRSSEGGWFSARLHPYRTEDDHIAGVVITLVDVTELRRAEEARYFLASIVESSKDAIITVDFAGNITSWNTAAEELYGYPAAEAVGKPLSMLTLPEDLKGVLEAADAVRRGETVEAYEAVRVHKDGRQLNLELRLSPVKDAAGRIIGVSTIARDLTERKLVDEELLARDEELRARDEELLLLLQSVTDHAIFTMDTEGRITRWNTGARNVFGFTEEDALGRNTAIIFTPEDRESGEHLKEMETAKAKGCAADERWHVRKDGSRFYASGVLTPLLRGGSVVGYVKVARDLTGERLLEEERAALTRQLDQEHSQLEQRIEERTAALLQEVAERKAAEERVRELVTRIVGTQELERRRMSRDLHDMLGQQLTALRLNLEAAREMAGDGEKVAARIEQAQEVAARLEGEIDFLAWELRPAALDEFGLPAALENFVHEWSKHFNVAADYHSTGLRKGRLAPDAETNLYRIAQEALNNVAKHAGATRVGVILERRDGDLALIVEDDGKGFEPGGEAVSSERGMGLLSMRERAALLGGELDIESAPGDGTTVFVRIPLPRDRKGTRNA